MRRHRPRVKCKRYPRVLGAPTHIGTHTRVVCRKTRIFFGTSRSACSRPATRHGGAGLLNSDPHTVLATPVLQRKTRSAYSLRRSDNAGPAQRTRYAGSTTQDLQTPLHIHRLSKSNPLPQLTEVTLAANSHSQLCDAGHGRPSLSPPTWRGRRRAGGVGRDVCNRPTKEHVQVSVCQTGICKCVHGS